METLDFGLHDILIYEMKNRKGKGGKYFKKEKEESIWRRKTFFGGEKTEKEIFGIFTIFCTF